MKFEFLELEISLEVFTTDSETLVEMIGHRLNVTGAGLSAGPLYRIIDPLLEV